MAWADIANHVVISQVCFNAPGTETLEEYVELYNPTSADISLNGWKLKSINGANAAQTTEHTFGTADTIPAYGFYLIGATNYNTVIGSPNSDVNMGACDIQNGPDGVLLANAANDTIDLVGWGSGGVEPYFEGTQTFSNKLVLVRKASASSSDATLPDTGSESDAGHGWDTDNNSNDFVLFNDFTSCNRHNKSSTAEQPAVNQTICAIQDIAAGPVRHGVSDSNTLMAGSMDTGPRIIEMIVDTAAGSTASAAELPALVLWRDVNSDSKWDSGDVSLGSIPWNSTRLCYAMSGSTWNQTAFTPFNFVFTVSVADTASLTDGHVIKISLKSDSGFLLDHDPGTTADDEWVPSNTLTNGYFRTINTELRTAELAIVQQAADSVAAGQSNKLITAVKIPDDAGLSYVLKDVRLVPSGTLTSSEYSVKVWHDDGDGVFETAQDTPYYLAWNTDHWETPADTINAGIKVGGDTLFISVSIGNTAVAGRGLQLKIPSTGGDAFTTAPRVTNNLSADITSNLISVAPKPIFNEVAYSSTNAYAEYFELYNPNSMTINLNGGGTKYYLGDGEGAVLTFPAGATIAPGGFYLVARNGNAFCGDFTRAPLPNAEYDTAGGAGGDSATIADMGVSNGTVMALGDPDNLYIRLVAGAGVEEIIWKTLADSDGMPEGTYTGTVIAAFSTTQSSGRINDGVEGSEPSGANSEDLAAAFVTTGQRTPGQPNNYLNIITPSAANDSIYITIGLYKTNGDTLTAADSNITVRSMSGGCTFTLGASGIGTVISGNNTSTIVIKPSSGYIRFLAYDSAVATVTFDAHCVGFSSTIAWYDTSIASFTKEPTIRITEVAPDEAVEYVELYVVDAGGESMPTGATLWDGGANRFASAFAGITQLSGGDYIICWGTTGTSETNNKNAGGGTAGVWDLYDNTLSLVTSTEDAVELRNGAGTPLDAMYYGPTDYSGSFNATDASEMQVGYSAGQWTRERSDTFAEVDQVHHRATVGWSMSRNAAAADDNSKYSWGVALITPGAACGSDFQQYSGGGTCDTAYPQYVYPGMANLTLRFTYNNDSATALSGSFLALEAPSGYAALNSSSVQVSYKDSNDTSACEFVSDTMFYVELTGNFTTAPDTIGFSFGVISAPAGTGTDSFLIKSDLYGTAVKKAGHADARCTVRRVYPDTIDINPDTAASLWGEQDVVTCTALYQGHPVAGVPITLVITSKGDVDGTRVAVNGTTYSTYWVDAVTLYTMNDGTCSFIVLTDPDDTATNTVNIKFPTGAGTTGSDTFTDSTSVPSAIITEVMYAPISIGASSGSTYEWIELANTTAADVDLNGWTIKDEGQADFVFSSSAILPAYGYLVVSRLTAAELLASDYGYSMPGVTIVQMATMQLNSTSQYIKLIDNNGIQRDNFTYDQSWGGYVTGMSIQKNNPTASGNVSTNWSGDTIGTTVRYGTPGHLNSNAAWPSVIVATGATANGVDTATIQVTLMTLDSHPVPNHKVALFPTFGSYTMATTTGTTNAKGIFTTTATSTTAGKCGVGFAVTAEDSIAVSDTAAIWFYTASGFSAVDGETVTSSISGINEIRSVTTGANRAVLGAQWSNDAEHLVYMEGDFSTVKGNPGSDRRVYALNYDGGTPETLSIRSMNPCPYGRVNVANIDGAAGNEAVFCGYVTSYGQPFWGIFYVPTAGLADTIGNPEGYNISPERTNLNVWTPDVTDNGLTKAGAAGPLNIAVSENGDVIAYAAAYVLAKNYFDRTPGHASMARLVRGYSSGQYLGDPTSYRSYFWMEPTWSPDGQHLALTRVDFRERVDGDATNNIFQSEIWVLKNAANFIAAPADPGDAALIRISPQTITEDAAGAADGQWDNNPTNDADTFYMSPQWSRDGKVISYAYDQTSTFNLATFLNGPVAGLTGTNFDVVMRYVGDLNFSGGVDTYPEQTVLSGAGNEFSMSWSPVSATVPAQMAGLAWLDGQAKIKTFDLASEATVTASGGILFDNGVVTAVVGANDTLAAGTVIRVSAAELTDQGSCDTMVAAGEAREFWPDGWTSGDPILVILHYDAADLLAADIVDGSLEESTLKVFWWDDANNIWVDYEGVVNVDQNTITFFTTHFSTYAIFRQLEPSAANSSLTLDKSIAYSDRIDGMAIRALVRDDTGNPVPNLRVTFATDRGDQVEYLEGVTTAGGSLTAILHSDRPGTTVVRCVNLPGILTDTFVVEFIEPPDYAGLIANPALPGVYLYVAAGSFADSDVGFSIVFPATGDSFSLYNRASERARHGDQVAVFLNSLLTADVAAEFHAKRRGNGASLDRSFLRPVRVIFDIPAALAAETRRSLTVFLLDELDDDHDGITDEWVALPTTFDEAASQVWADVPHFSIYRLGSTLPVVSGMNDIVVYPNPWRADRHASNANPGVKILLPVNRSVNIRIYNLAGQLIEANDASTAGGVNSFAYVWDLNNSHGRRVASGVYFIVIRDLATNETTIRKVALIL